LLGERLLTSRKKTPVTSTRTIAAVTGWLFLITFITSIPAAFVFSPPGVE
jgi:hypothetical protein